ncbi:hypothetical protein IV203_028095 [Nitzschia inconspicua]|uniref:Uncharacterized protein n=1 Tax=Nitzschia inconspicua TaxID=303405 RepID=A0A9K3Q6P4_9STRA|nr:hypothetical protein IV203_028095 [Nitzschia inconspicua]
MYTHDTANSFSGNAKALSDLLEEQYNVTEAYANAQTLLWNAINQRIPETGYNSSINNNDIISGDDYPDDPSRLTVIAVKRQYQALRNVQTNLKQQELLHRHHQQHHNAISQHLALSKRVLQTLSHSPCLWQTNGIALPQQQSTGLDAKATTATAAAAASATVALAVLKASIAQLLQVVSEENQTDEKRMKA